MAGTEVFLKNIPPDTTEFVLEMLVENGLKCTVQEVLLSEDKTEAVVKIEEVLEDSSCTYRKTLHGQVISVERCPYCIEVSHPGGSISEELIKMYFESKKRSGGRSESVTYIKAGEKKTVLGFNDKEVREQITLKGRHKLSGQDLAVSKCSFPLINQLSSEKSEETRESDTAMSEPYAAVSEPYAAVREPHSLSKEIRRVPPPLKPKPQVPPPLKPKPQVHRESKVPKIEKQMKPVPSVKYHVTRLEIEEKAATCAVKLNAVLDSKTATITLEGTELNINKLQVQIMELWQDIHEFIVDIPQEIQTFLQEEHAMKELQKMLSGESIKAELSISPTGELLLVSGEEKCDSYVSAVKACFSLENMPLSRANVSFMQKASWKTIKAAQEKSFVRIKENLEQLSLDVYGFADAVQNTLIILQALFEQMAEDNVQKDYPPMSKLMFDLIRDNLTDEISKQGVTMKTDFTGDEVKLQLKGPPAKVEEVIEFVDDKVKNQVSKPLDLPAFVVEVLQNEKALQELKKHIIGKWTTSVFLQQKKPYLLCNQAKFKDVKIFIQGLFCQRTIAVGASAEHYVGGEEWKNQKKIMQQSGLILIKESSSQIDICGFSSAVDDAKGTVDLMLKGRTTKVENITITNTAEYNFIDKYLKHQLQEIAEKIFSDKVTIHCTETAGTCVIKIKGNVADVGKAVKEVNKLRGTIGKESCEAKQYGMVEYITKDDGAGIVQRVERSCQCAIDVQISGKAVSKHNIKVKVGDITSFPAEVLVCSIANGESDLPECGAVAAAFNKTGGAALEQDFATHNGLAEGKVIKSSTVASLSCQFILYLSIRDWNAQSSKLMLQPMIDDCLSFTQQKQLSSIAFPTMGCGKMGYPPAELARCFAASSNMIPGIEVTIVAYANDAIYTSICNTLEQATDSHPGHSHGASPVDVDTKIEEFEDVETGWETQSDCEDSAEDSEAEMEFYAPPLFMPSASNLTVIVADITKVQSDVLVNTLGQKNDDLTSCGVIANSFIKVVGATKLQDDFKSTGGLALGQVSISGVKDNLPCKLLLHMGLDTWKGDETAKVIVQGITTCLQEVKKRGHTSVAFPALGTGNLKFPPVDVAKCFQKAVKQYPTIKVEIVSFKLDKTYTEINDTLTGHVSAPSPTPVVTNVHVKVGDITKQTNDVVVNSLGRKHKDLAECGEIAKAFHRVVGDKLKDDFEKTGGLGPGVVSVSRVIDNLSCLMLLHLGLDEWKNGEGRENLIKGIKACLKIVQQKSHRSISFPALGTGNLKTPPKDLAQCLKQCATDFPNIQIDVVVFKKDKTYDELHAELSRSPAGTTTPGTSTPGTSTAGTPIAGTSSSGAIVSNGQVVVGDITKIKADVLVNSVANNETKLEDTGAVGTAFSSAGGSQFCQDFTAAGGLDEGIVRDYAANLGTLQCQLVLHVSIRSWTADKDKVLMTILRECFKLTRQNKLKSIAIPTLGCGQLKYPVDTVVRCFKTVASENPDIKVQVIAYQRDNIYDAFHKGFHAGPTKARSLRVTKAQKFREKTELPRFVSMYARPKTTREEIVPAKVVPVPVAPDAPRPEEYLTFAIYAKDNGVAKQAKAFLDEGLKREYKEVTLDGQTHKMLVFLQHVDAKYKTELFKITSSMACMSYDEQHNTVSVKGVKRDVEILTRSIQDLLLQVEQEITPEIVKKVKGTKEYLRHIKDMEPRTPKSWTKFADLTGEEAKLKTHAGIASLTGGQYLVDVDSTTFKAVESLMLKSWDLSKTLTVKKVERVENPVSYCDYTRHCKSLLEQAMVDDIKPVTASKEADVHTATLGLTALDQLCIREINEYLFFHGTKDEITNSIVAQGFDSRLAYNGFFGRGIYLAEMASKSHQYTGGSPRKVFIVKAPLGNIHVSQDRHAFVRPPCMADGCTAPKCSHSKFYNSVLGKHGTESKDNFKYREYIQYENGLCYPLFCVTYEVA